MEKYRTLHLWMLIPMVIMQAGIYIDYWGDFTENAWSVHVHFWTGTVWYLYLILQPYFATHGKMARHRENGIIGMFLAGGVCITALSMMNRDIVNAQYAADHPDQLGPFQPWFFMGVAAVEIVMMVAFGFAVIKSIIHRKKLEDHAWWLISTVFIIMMPALGRGMQNLYIAVYAKEWPNLNIMIPIFYAEILIIAMLMIGAYKYKKLTHTATYLALFVNVFNCFLEPLGRSEGIQHLLKSVLKG